MHSYSGRGAIVITLSEVDQRLGAYWVTSISLLQIACVW